MKLAWGILLLGGCSAAHGPTNAVDLTIFTDQLSDAARARVTELKVTVSGLGSPKDAKYVTTGLRPVEKVQILPSVTSGMIDIAVTVSDEKMNLLGQGTTPAPIPLGGIRPVNLTLQPVAPPTITVTPATATVTRKKTQKFSADHAVVWSASSGSIDSDGLFTAPDMPGGPITITATSASDDTNTGTAMVTVADYGVELLAGAIGGWGSADGLGAAARFCNPSGVASDQKGSIYVSDVFSCVLRRYDIATQTVTTIGGHPNECGSADGMLGADARFGLYLRALAYDDARNVLWLADLNVLRRIDLSTGEVKTLTKDDGSTLFFGSVAIGGLVFDPANDVLYVASSKHVIYRVSPSPSPSPTVFAGTLNTPGSAETATGPATLASFNSPSGLALDGTNLYVADTGNQTVRKIEVATGVTSIVAGSTGIHEELDGVGTAAHFANPATLALSANQSTLYVGDRGGVTIRAIALANGSVSRVAGTVLPSPSPGAPYRWVAALDGSPGTSAVFSSLGSMVVDTSSGGTTPLFVADAGNGVLRTVTPPSYAVQTVAGTSQPWGYRDGTGPIARFWQVGAVASDGKLYYIADESNAVVRTYDPETGEVATLAGSAGLYGPDDGVGAAARFERADGMFIDGNILYVTDSNASTLRQIDLGTKLVTTLAGQYKTGGTNDGMGSTARFLNPIYLVGDHADHLYIQDWGAPILRRYTISTGQVDTVVGNVGEAVLMDGVGLGARLVGPYGMAIENSVLYLCDPTAIRSVTLDTFTVTTVAGGATAGLADGTGLNAQFRGLLACVGDGRGHIAVGDTGRIRWFDTATTAVSTLVGVPDVIAVRPGSLATARVNYFGGGAFTSQGDLIYGDGESTLMLLRFAP